MSLGISADNHKKYFVGEENKITSPTKFQCFYKEIRLGNSTLKQKRRGKYTRLCSFLWKNHKKTPANVSPKAEKKKHRMRRIVLCFFRFG